LKTIQSSAIIDNNIPFSEQNSNIDLTSLKYTILKFTTQVRVRKNNRIDEMQFELKVSSFAFIFTNI